MPRSVATTGAEPRSTWAWHEALGVVIAAHVVLILGGATVVVLGGWSTEAGSRLPITAQFAALVPFWVVAVAASWWFAAKRSEDPAAALGLSLRPVDVPVGVVTGVVTQFAVIPLVYWPLLRLLDQDLSDVERAARQLVDTAGGAFGTTLLVVMTCVAAPLVEEVLYRGLLQRAEWPGHPLTALVGTAVAFGLLHFQPLQFLGLVMFGLAAGSLVRRSDRIGPAVVAHMAFNASTVVPLLLRR